MGKLAVSYYTLQETKYENKLFLKNILESLEQDHPRRWMLDCVSNLLHLLHYKKTILVGFFIPKTPLPYVHGQLDFLAPSLEEGLFLAVNLYLHFRVRCHE